MNTPNEAIGGMSVSNPAYCIGVIKYITNLRAEPNIKEANAAGRLDFFQNNPNVRGAHAPAKTMSNASIR